MSTAGQTRPAPAARALFWLIVAGSALVLALGLLAQFSGYQVLDDSFMFVRYAGNVIRHGTVAWNLEDGPAYGVTSLLHLSVVCVVQWLSAADPSLVAYLSSMASGVAFAALLLVLLRRHRGMWGQMLGAFAVGTAAWDISFHCSSGMDTTLAMAWVTAYILLAKEHERLGKPRSAVLLGLFGGLSYFARPDLLLFALGAPAAILAFGPSRAARRLAAVVLGITAAVVAAQMAAAAAWLGSPLPLPFYAKSTRLYGPSVYEVYRRVPWLRLLAYAADCWPLLAAFAVALLASPRRSIRRMPPAELGLLAASLAFLAYYLLFVLQIESSSQRFYFPTFPALAFLGAGVLDRWAEALPDRTRRRFLRSALPLGVVAVLLVLVGLVRPLKQIRAHWSRKHVRANFATFDLLKTYEPYGRQWYRLDRVARLPDDLTIATTELGIPAALCPGKTIADMVGLHNPYIARRGFDPEAFLSHYQPDLIYMPVDYYRQMRHQLAASRRFRQHYDLLPATQLGTVLGVALRRDSPHYPELRGIMLAPR